jgi:hypothetical protein
MAKLDELKPGQFPLPRPRPELLFEERWNPVTQGQFEGVMRDRIYPGTPTWFPQDMKPGEQWRMPNDRQFGPETPGRYPQMPRDLHALIQQYLENARRLVWA